MSKAINNEALVKAAKFDQLVPVATEMATAIACSLEVLGHYGLKDDEAWAAFSRCLNALHGMQRLCE